MDAMSELWLYLLPKETELILRPVAGTGEHADLLRTIQGKVDKVKNDVILTGAEVIRVRAAARNWRLGYEKQFKALDSAVNRHI